MSLASNNTRVVGGGGAGSVKAGSVKTNGTAQTTNEMYLTGTAQDGAGPGAAASQSNGQAAEGGRDSAPIVTDNYSLEFDE